MPVDCLISCLGFVRPSISTDPEPSPSPLASTQYICHHNQEIVADSQAQVQRATHTPNGARLSIVFRWNVYRSFQALGRHWCKPDETARTCLVLGCFSIRKQTICCGKESCRTRLVGTRVQAANGSLVVSKCMFGASRWRYQSRLSASWCTIIRINMK